MDRRRKIAIVGLSGAGKTTLASALEARLGLPHVELDSIHHLAGWTPIDRDEMRAIVAERIAAPAWVVDGNYGSFVQDLVLSAADTVVWIDLPRHVIMPAITVRTLRRMALGTELWNGNRERVRNLFTRDPSENIILWAWTQHGPTRTKYEARMADPAYAHLTWVRLRSRGEVRRWLDAASPGT